MLKRKIIRKSKKKKGFTLIELLAVILILGIIALIAIPTVNSVVKQSNKGAFESGVRNVLKTVENQCAMDMLNGNSETKYYDFSEEGVTLGLDLKGKIPTSGTIIVDSDCKTMVSVSDGNYTASKLVTEEEISFKEGNDAINYLQIPTIKNAEEYKVIFSEDITQEIITDMKNVITNAKTIEFLDDLYGSGLGFYIEEDEIKNITELLIFEKKKEYKRESYDEFLKDFNFYSKKNLIDQMISETIIDNVLKTNTYYVFDEYVVFVVADMKSMVENGLASAEEFGEAKYKELYDSAVSQYGEPTLVLNFK